LVREHETILVVLAVQDALLHSYIQKENQVLFPTAERLLDPDTQARLAEHFAAHDAARNDADQLLPLLAEAGRPG
jgi:hemerythrin-like domain-containing protein